MARWTLCCHYLPAVWHIRISGCSPRLNLAFVILTVLALFIFILIHTNSDSIKYDSYKEYVDKFAHLQSTDIGDPNLYYGIVIDAGSSGTRVFVYFWPKHSGGANELLAIQQMRDEERNPVVKRIRPGITSLAENPQDTLKYLAPLLDYASDHIPFKKHPETPLYILATAGMRMLPQSQQDAILMELRTGIPVRYDFMFSDTHVEVISGKQEGVYAWIGINYVLGRFNHAENNDPMIEVEVTDKNKATVTMLRKRTVGILDMGGGSAQIAFEVPRNVEVNFAGKEGEQAKSLMAEFNLGCGIHDYDHEYRVYVTTFLGYGGNMARNRYARMMINATLSNTKSNYHTAGTSPEAPILDPCLSLNMVDTVEYQGTTKHFKGTGDFTACQAGVQPLLNLTAPCQNPPCSFNGMFQPEIDFGNSEFYGFSEYWYCMEDILRMGGTYDLKVFQEAAKDYCATRWSQIQQHYKNGLYSKADEHRLRYQCFKSAWITTVLHEGYRFPRDYEHLRTVSLIHDKEVQWTLGAILHRTRFLPLREIQHGIFQKSYRPPWLRASVMSNEYLFIVCFITVFIFIVLYVRWLRRMDHRRPDLPRVPTMAYFMTDEGQVQDGIKETSALYLG